MLPNIFLLAINNIFLFYTDPGSGALLLQLIIASLVGGLFYFRKIKDKIFGKSSSKKVEIDSQK
jgi:hypothetical protein